MPLDLDLATTGRAEALAACLSAVFDRHPAARLAVWDTADALMTGLRFSANERQAFVDSVMQARQRLTYQP